MQKARRSYIVEVIGIVSIVASLIFVGLQWNPSWSIGIAPHTGRGA